MSNTLSAVLSCIRLAAVFAVTAMFLPSIGTAGDFEGCSTKSGVYCAGPGDMFLKDKKCDAGQSGGCESCEPAFPDQPCWSNGENIHWGYKVWSGTE